MNTISDVGMQREAEISAVLDAYVYMNKWAREYSPSKPNEYLSLEELCTTYSKQNLSEEAKTYLKIIQDAINNDKSNTLGNMRLISHSVSELGEGSDDLLVSCAFADPSNGNVYFAYRGTGDGKWIDNGVGMADESSQMQLKANEYFEKVIDKYGLDNYNDGKIIVTGHSKGGNSAQYVTMFSKYAHLIDNCYSFDGQGFSSLAITEMENRFKDKYGENWEIEYKKQIQKMYSINGKNDYVHDLGITIINEDQTYYVNIVGEDGFMEWHGLNFLFNGDGSFNWEFTEQGPIGKFAKELSLNMMALDYNDLKNCAVSIMHFLELTIGGGQGTGDIKFAEPEQIVGFINVGIPLIVNTIKNSDNIDDVFKLLNLNISKNHWLVEPLLDIAIEISENMTLEEYEGYVSLVNELSTYMKNNGMELNDFIEYIKEDPIRLVGVYASLDLGKKGLHEAIAKIFAPKNISRILASFMCEHPILTGATVAALSVPAIRGALVTVAGFVIAAGAVYLIANHIITNWDTIQAKLIEGAEYIKDKVAELYTELKNKLIEQLNNYAEDVLSGIEKIITVGERVINYAVDQVGDFIGYLRDACKVAIKAAFMICNPILYAIASKLYNASKEPVKINMVRLRQCVNTMNKLASRVANIDSRLDNLYYQLSRNNIEQGEGIFTSLANMYNLFRADLNVDEGQAIKRKARALSELFEDCEKTDEWVSDHVPQSI